MFDKEILEPNPISQDRICENPFCRKPIPQTRRARYCDNTCGRAAWHSPHAKAGVNPHIAQRLTTALVLADLMLKGYEVFEATTAVTLIAIKDGRAIRVEPRTAYRQPDGKLKFNAPKIAHDAIAAVDHKERAVIYLPPGVV